MHGESSQPSGRSPAKSSDRRKTKAELIAELVELRQRTAEPESGRGREQRPEAGPSQLEILESIVDNLGDGVVVVDPEGKFVLFNPVAERILGIGMTDVPPKRWSEVYGVYRPDRVTPFPWNELPLIRALSGEEAREVEMFIRHPGIPEGVFITVTGTPLKSRGELTGAVAVVRDVTRIKQAAETKRLRDERRQVEAELEKLRDELVRQTRFSAIGEVAASIAHDLRNPLGAIRNSHYYLTRRLSSTQPDWARHLEIIGQEIHTADRIIDNLLDMSRAGTPAKEPVDLGRMIDETLKHHHTWAGIHARVELECDPFMVHADPSQMGRLLGNLITNALQAMEGGGHMNIEARHETEHDVIAVADDGKGVAAELRDRVFEPLFTTRAKGTGLGLAICRRIAELHGGTIELLDTRQRGSVFRVRIPRENVGGDAS